VDDIGTLETTAINNGNEITTSKTNIPTLPLSATQANYTNANNYKTSLDVYLKNIDTLKSKQERI
jgi:hypothetical protein